MNRLFEDSVRGRIGELKELYVQFLLLLDQGIEEEADEDGGFPQSEKLDKSIEALMRDIKGRTADFEQSLNEIGNWRVICPPELRSEIEEFGTNLHGGLDAMARRVQGRIAELSEERDTTKDQLKGLRDQRAGGRAYRGPGNPVSTLFDSKA